MPRSLPYLLSEARRVLGIPNQAALGELLGSSAHTGQRWERGQATMMPHQLQKIVSLVHARDPALAAEMAGAASTTLAQLGIDPAPAQAPAAASAAVVTSAPDPAFLVDTVVCAAAEAMDVMPEGIRPALRAAFRRARLARLSVEDIDAALNAPESTSKEAASAVRR